MVRPLCLRLLLGLGFAISTLGAPSAPTLTDIRYGDHPRQKLDLWQARSSSPTPWVFFLHEGGWVNGDKRIVPHLADYLAAGISVVSANYRYTTEAQEAGVWPPIQWPIRDAARALQFARSRASQWNLDKRRVGASGQSAGACSSLWLAFHDDLADPASRDPVARESTRPWCAGVTLAQTSLDPRQMQEWTPNSNYGGHAFGFMPDPHNLKTRDTEFPQFLAARERLLPWIEEFSPFALARAGAPPIYLFYTAAPGLGRPQKDPTHTANFGVKLQEKLRRLGVDCELVYPGAPGIKHPTVESYLIETLISAK